MLSKLLRTSLRASGWVLLALLTLLALVVLAWLAFNLGQTPAKPLPPELQVQAPRLPDERNAAYFVEGLLAEAGRDPATAGRASWAAAKAWGALPPAQRASAAATRDSKINEAMGSRLAAPRGKLLTCAGRPGSCDADWLADPETLATQRAEFGPIGQRCDQLIDGALEFEELAPAGRGADAPWMAWLPVTLCSRWFRSGTIVALARGKRDEALAQLERADRLHRRVWEGARTLIGHMVGTRLARDTYNAMATVALREPVLAEPMAPWLSAPLDTRVGVRRWVPFEVAFQHGVIDDLVAGMRAGQASAGLMSGSTDLHGGLTDWLSAHGIGFDVELTKQRMGEPWLQLMASLQQPWPAILADAAGRTKAAQEREQSSTRFWRNTFGEILASTLPTDSYLARHADHELHREATALVLAMQRQHVLAPQRADVARKHPGLSAVLEQRMSWSADNRTLTVRTWQSETTGARYDERRDAIVFTWPR